MTMEVVMMSRSATSSRSLVKMGVLLGAGALATMSTGTALAGVNDPLQLLYLIPGIADNGGADGAGIATAVHCFSFSGSSEMIKFVVRDFDGTVKTSQTFMMSPLNMRTAATHDTNLYAEDFFLNTGAVFQGGMGISATTTSMVCTAEVLDASATIPNGIARHAIRLSPLPGSLE